MRRLLTSCAAVIACSTAFAPAFAAQQPATVTFTVRDERGDSLPFARIWVLAAWSDTTLRADWKGQAKLKLNFSRIHVRATMIGYQPIERDVDVNTAELKETFVLAHVPQQLSTVSVAANWLGVRGLVGDSRAMLALPGATIRTQLGDQSVQSDSTGAFQLELREAKRTILVAEHAGFISRTLFVSLPAERAPDVTVLLAPGKTTTAVKTRLYDLRMRTAYLDKKALILSRDDLDMTRKNLQEAFLDAELLKQKGLRVSNRVCVFVNGVPNPGVGLLDLNVGAVDFIEVYGQDGDHTDILRDRWRGRPCGETNRVANPGASAIRFVNVWTRDW